MITLLHAVFILISGKVYFVVVISNFPGRKMRFSASSQNSISEKSVLGHFKVIFLNVLFFSTVWWLFPVSTFKAWYFNERMSSVADLKKSFSISRKSTDVGHFWLPRSTFKVDFRHVQAKVRKIHSQFPRRGFFGILCQILSFLSIVACGGGSRFVSRRFPKSVILASSNFVGRPFVACYACSIVYFHSS